MAGLLKAGFGASCITPPLPCRLDGYVRRQSLSRQVSTQLWARSIVLDDGEARVGWVTCELLEVDRSLVADIRAAVEATGPLAGRDLLVSATHTHAGPDLYRDWDDDDLGHRDARAVYRGFLPLAVASSLVSAVQDLSPAALAWTEEAVDGVAADRRSATARPQRLSVLSATADGHLKGLVVIFPCHGTVLGPSNLAVSGDIVGACTQALEASTGATGRCAWAQGAAGDISTRSTRRSRAQPEVERLGSLVAAAAQRALGRACPVAPEPSIRLGRAVVPLPHRSAEQFVAFDAVGPSARADEDRSEAALAEEAAAARNLRRDGSRQPEHDAEVAVLRIGEVTICFVPGEPFNSIERAVVEKTGLNELRVVGYSNGAPGYIFGPDEDRDGGYEVMSSPLTGEAGPRIVAACTKLVLSQE